MDLLHFWEQVEASPPNVSFPIHPHRLQGFCVRSAELVGIPGVSWQHGSHEQRENFPPDIASLGFRMEKPRANPQKNSPCPEEISLGILIPPNSRLDQASPIFTPELIKNPLIKAQKSLDLPQVGFSLIHLYFS